MSPKSLGTFEKRAPGIKSKLHSVMLFAPGSSIEAAKRVRMLQCQAICELFGLEETEKFFVQFVFKISG